MQEPFPYVALVRREHDFRVVETSVEFPLSVATREEARWLALDWWGNCFVENFAGALGHVPAKETPDMFLLMLVQPGPVAPDRFVVFLTTSEYSRFGFNPFHAVERGVFDFTEEFYRRRGEQRFFVDWKRRVRRQPVEDIITSETQRCYERAGHHLSNGHSLLVPTHADTSELFKEFEDFTHFLFPDVLRKAGIFTFTNTTSDKLDHFGTLLASVYNSTQTRTFSDFLQDLVPVDEHGSLFTTIRRTENMQ